MVTLPSEERDGKTILTTTSLYETAEARDAMLLRSGMEAGARETWDRLAELVESMA